MNTSHSSSRSRRSRWLHAGAALAASVALVACGGRSDGDSAGAGATTPPPGTQVPNGSTNSVAGVIAFLMALISTTSETGEPIAVGDVVLATSETDEPTPLQ